MMNNKNSDVSALQDYLGPSGRIDYVDFQEAAAVEEALRRWPLLRRLMQQPQAAPQQPGAAPRR